MTVCITFHSGLMKKGHNRGSEDDMNPYLKMNYPDARVEVFFRLNHVREKCVIVLFAALIRYMSGVPREGNSRRTG